MAHVLRSGLGGRASVSHEAIRGKLFSRTVLPRNDSIGNWYFVTKYKKRKREAKLWSWIKVDRPGSRVDVKDNVTITKSLKKKGRNGNSGCKKKTVHRIF